MCASFIIRTLFSLALLLATILIIVAALTPWWRNFNVEEKARGVAEGKDYTVGLLSVFCGDAKTTDPDLRGKCERAFNKRPPQEKTMLICMALALVCCILTYLWSCVACFACCCDSCLLPPLAIFTGIAAVSLSIGVVTYVVVTEKNPFNDIPDSWKAFYAQPDFGLSLWLTIAAVACLIVNVITGIAMIRLQKSPIGTMV